MDSMSFDIQSYQEQPSYVESPAFNPINATPTPNSTTTVQVVAAKNDFETWKTVGIVFIVLFALLVVATIVCLIIFLAVPPPPPPPPASSNLSAIDPGPVTQMKETPGGKKGFKIGQEKPNSTTTTIDNEDTDGEDNAMNVAHLISSLENGDGHSENEQENDKEENQLQDDAFAKAQILNNSILTRTQVKKYMQSNK